MRKTTMTHPVRTAFSDSYYAKTPQPSMRKLPLVAQQAADAGFATLVEPQPASRADLERIHRHSYVESILSGNGPLSECAFGFWSEAYRDGVLAINGGNLLAARMALEDGIAANVAQGFHHAAPRNGGGFCTFNGLVVALEALRAEGKIRTAAILDMDLHYGNGTASLAASRPWLRALSIYGNDYWNNQPYRDVTKCHHTDGPNHFSVHLIPSGKSDREVLLGAMNRHLRWLIQDAKPDILLYQAGADPLRDDPYSPLQLTHEDLETRDRMVFEFAKSENIPVAWVLAGGYCPEIEKVVRVHLNTARACREVFEENRGLSGM